MDLLERLSRYAATDALPMHMPGHKRRDLGGQLPWKLDITEIDGFDDLHDAQGILRDAMDRAAGLYGSRRAFFLVNGSTCGILAGICAATRPGDAVLLPRGCHRAVYNALELRELTPVYLETPTDPAFGIAASLPPETVSAALAAHPEVRLVILTSPTYEGVISDVAAITALAHRAGVPVLVDEAHGAHLGLSPAFPGGAVAAGADIVIQSLHKTLPSLTQTALAHWNSDLVPEEELARQLSCFQTSSPSYLLLGSIDRCVRLMAARGQALLSEHAQALAGFDETVSPLRRLRVLCHGADRPADHPALFAFDPGKLVLSTRGTELTGPALMERLRQTYHIELEMALGDYALAMTSLCDSPETLGRLASALLDIDRGLAPRPAGANPAPAGAIPPRAMLPGQARRLPGEQIPAENACGRVAGERLWAYPPGIPLLIPGELVTNVLLSTLADLAARGVRLHGERGDPPRTLYVLKDAGPGHHA